MVDLYSPCTGNTPIGHSLKLSKLPVLNKPFYLIDGGGKESHQGGGGQYGKWGGEGMRLKPVETKQYFVFAFSPQIFSHISTLGNGKKYDKHRK